MIKKYLIVLVFILSLTFNCLAQVRCGFIGGVNISKISSDELIIPNLTGATLGSFGGVFDIGVKNGLSLYLAPMYIEKGAGFEVNNPEPFSADLNISFFEIPVFVKYSFGDFLRPYVFTGPTLAVNIASNIETRIGGFSMEIDARDMTNSLELGITLGSGFSYVTDAVTLFVEGRYNIGLTDVSKSGSNSVSIFGGEIEDVSIQLPDLQTSGFQLLIGFALPFNGGE